MFVCKPLWTKESAKSQIKCINHLAGLGALTKVRPLPQGHENIVFGTVFRVQYTICRHKLVYNIPYCVYTMSGTVTIYGYAGSANIGTSLGFKGSPQQIAPSGDGPLLLRPLSTAGSPQPSGEPNGEDIDCITHCTTDYLNFCTDIVVPVKTEHCFAHNKP